MKNGTRSSNLCIFPGPISPIFPNVTNNPTGPLIKNLGSKYPVENWGKFEVSRGSKKIGYFLGLLCVSTAVVRESNGSTGRWCLDKAVLT